MTAKACSVCGRPGQTRKGMCAAHYVRWKNTGDPGPAELLNKPKGSVQCSDGGCDRAAVSKGLCDRHYREQRRATADERPVIPWHDRFLAKVDRRGDDECWPWTGCVNKQTGYGEFNLNGKTVSSHRLAYEYGHGPVPDGLTIDHVWDNGCTRRDCQNWVSHLEAVTQAENVRRGNSLSARYARAPECPNRHEYTPETTVMLDGQRRCRICLDAKHERRNATKRERRRSA